MTDRFDRKRVGLASISFLGSGARRVSRRCRRLGWRWAAEKTAGPATPPRPLEWDALEKRVTPTAGLVETLFEFKGEQAWLADRRSDRREGVVRLHDGGFAGNALMPGLGAKGTLRVRVDFRWKHGIFRKTVPVHTAAGSQTLILTVNIPEAGEAERRWNQELAAGKRGQELFFAVWTVCYPKESRDAVYWQKWIGEGKDGMLMPAVAATQGGPLTGNKSCRWELLCWSACRWKRRSGREPGLRKTFR